MATEKQIAANRENARKSTGPRTEQGKRRSRRNSIRHGLTAETVIKVLEDEADYESLAAAINSDFRPATNFETQLIARLISLLWRLRRATAIESGLLAIGAQALRSRRMADADNRLSIFYSLVPSLVRQTDCKLETQGPEMTEGRVPGQSQRAVETSDENGGVARSFLRLASKNANAFEHLRRYEMSLWRQTVQIVLLLNATNRRERGRVTHGPKELRLKSLRTKNEGTLWPPLTF